MFRSTSKHLNKIAHWSIEAYWSCAEWERFLREASGASLVQLSQQSATGQTKQKRLINEQSLWKESHLMVFWIETQVSGLICMVMSFYGGFLKFMTKILNSQLLNIPFRIASVTSFDSCTEWPITNEAAPKTLQRILARSCWLVIFGWERDHV